MALSGVIASFASGQPGNGMRTVTRTAVGTWAAGVYTPGSTSTIPIQALITPLTGKDLRALPEGLSADATKLLFTITELFGVTVSNTPDTLVDDGETWIVHHCQEWPMFGELVYRCHIAKKASVP